MKRYFNNPEIKKSSASFIFVMTIFLVCNFIIMRVHNEKLKDDYIKVFASVTAKIVETDPKLEKEIVPLLVREVTPQEEEKGRGILRQYGLSETLDTSLFPYIKGSFKSMELSIISIGLILTVILFILNYLQYGYFYELMRNFSSAAKRIVEGDYNLKLSEEKEGDLSKFTSSFNSMGEVIRGNIYALNKEKSFLVNLLSDISHQLKTPLSTMILYNDILLNKNLTKEKDLKKSFEKTMKKHKGNKKAQFITIIVFGIITVISLYFGKDLKDSNIGTPSGKLEISYLDVGQGDAAYIRVNDFDILVDAGPRSDADKLMKQLEEKNIDDFEIVIATHPHEDHIGGMVKVFEKYDVESFYMPKVTHTTKTFENMINAVSKEGLKAKVIKEGTSFDLGNGAKIEVYSPIYESYEEFNDYSPIMKLTFGNTSYMFTGDAEAHAEQEVVAKYPKNLDADVLKFGHHGSSTSSTKEFVEAVSPEYGVISCGVDNKYGHPHRETLQTIDTQGIKAYRTDKQGQITITSDGNTISVRTEK